MVDYNSVYLQGTYYCPATKHYPRSDGVRPNVVCDRCQKDNLQACIGWKEYDLCLSCVAKVEELCSVRPIDPTRRGPAENDPGSLTLMMQEQFRNPPARSTRMVQSMFQPPHPRTYMEQSMFRGSQCLTDMEQSIYRSNLDKVGKNRYRRL